MKKIYASLLLMVCAGFAFGAAPNTYSATETISSDEVFTDVSIDDGVVVTISSTGSLTCDNLDFQSMSNTLIVESGGNLILNGNVLNNENSTITIEHGGSMIPSATSTFATGNIVIEKDASSSGYSYISSPISDATYEGLVYTYNESMIDPSNPPYGTWESATVSNPIPVGIGYAGYADGSISFTGTPNVAAVNLMLSLNEGIRLAEPEKSGHHLIGNPFTAAIDMNAFFATGANTANTFNSYYVWNPANNGGDGGYDSFTGLVGEYISSGQAFFIQLDYTILSDGNFPVVLNPSIMVQEENTGFFRKLEDPLGEIVLNFSSTNDSNNKLTFRFDDQFSADFNKGFEAYSIPFDEAGELRLKSEFGAKHFDILALPKEEITIPISLKTTKALDINLEVLKMDYLEGYVVELVNKATNEAIVLNSGQNSTLNIGQLDNEVGFELRLTVEPVLGLEDETEALKVYTSNRQLIINRLNQKNDISGIRLYSLDGRQVGIWENISQASNQITIPTINYRNGIYVVKVQTSKGIYSNKIILN